MPRRRGKSKRTYERIIEDVVRSAKLESGDTNRLSEIKGLAKEEIPKKKQKIEILNVQIIQPPTGLINNLTVIEKQNIEVQNTLFTHNVETHNVDTRSTSNLLVEHVNPNNCSEYNNVDDDDFQKDSFSTYSLPISKNEQFMDDLKTWSLEFNIGGVALSALLLLLINYGLTFLPKDSRTLKNTPREVEVRQVDPGIYWHYGIKQYLRKLVNRLKSKVPNALTLNISMDGLPLCKSSKGAFWPILGKIKEIPSMKPFVIGLYYHISSKPKCPIKYLQDLVTELVDLENNTFMGKVVKVGIFVFDAVASAFIRGVVPHNAYKACPKCTTNGTYLSNRTCYPILGCSARTNESFRKRNDVEHHRKGYKNINSTPLEALNIDVVKSCPNDYMHLILLGVTKKFLKMILRKMKFPTNVLLRRKLDVINITNIEKAIGLARLHQPSDFCRKIRTLEFIKFFKATELRTFLCYHGIVVLKDNIDSEFYECFKILHCAVSICLSDKLIDLFLPVAEELFNTFIKLYVKIFGERMVSYNVHNLQHVVEDVKMYGRLDNSSAFEYESFLGKLKKLVHSGKHPLQEVSNRLMEHSDHIIEKLKKEIETKKEYPKFSKFVLEHSENIKLTNKNCDCWFITKENKIVRFEKIEIINKIPKIIGKAIKSAGDYFNLPIRSSLLGTYYSNGELEKIDPLDFTDISSKMFCIPDLKKNLVFITMLHT